MDFDVAVNIYTKQAQKNGQIQQPNAHLSELINGVWYLRNINGLLARVGTAKKRVFDPNGAAGHRPI